MVERNELAFGHYYKHLPLGEKKQFIDMVVKAMGLSVCHWQQHFVEWSRGIVRGKRMDEKACMRLALLIIEHLQFKNKKRSDEGTKDPLQHL